jgi:lysozyme family protein
MADFKQAQQIVGINEGGYQNDPKDSGNYFNGKLIGTNWGIAAPTLAEYLGREPSVSDMKNLKRSTAEDILRVNYWKKNHLDELSNQSVATLIYDGTVNQGTNGMRFLIDKAVKLIGGSINYYEVFTTKGIKYLNRFNQKRLFDAIKTVRANKYKSSTKTHYIKSWLNRLDRIKYYANNTLSSIWPFAALFMGAIGLFLIAL